MTLKREEEERGHASLLKYQRWYTNILNSFVVSIIFYAALNQKSRNDHLDSIAHERANFNQRTHHNQQMEMLSFNASTNLAMVTATHHNKLSLKSIGAGMQESKSIQQQLDAIEAEEMDE